MSRPPRWTRSRPPIDVEAAFSLRLDNFEGPFDLLLSLIAKHKLDVTEVALSTVTDEFIAHIKRGADDDRPPWDLEQTTAFLVVASTLLDLKTARLLPQGDVEDEEDLALLEARDLLFARLLQYQRVQAGGVGAGEADRERGAAPPARGRPRRAVRQPAARRADRARPGGVRGARGQGAGAEAGARALPRPHPCADRQREGAGGDRGRAAAPPGHADLPGPRRRRPRHADPGGPLPVAAGAVPRGRGGVRADEPARRAEHPLDRRRRGRDRDHRRVRRRPVPDEAPAAEETTDD